MTRHPTRRQLTARRLARGWINIYTVSTILGALAAAALAMAAADQLAGIGQ